MTRVLVTGATGLLGGGLLPVLRAQGFETISHGKSVRADMNADLTSLSQTHDLLDAVEPDVVVNLSALANVDACEASPASAYSSNVRTVENLVDWIRARSPRCHLVQLSTDQVYDGKGPHRENDVKVPNVYAFSKVAAELASACIDATVLRTNFFGLSRREGRTSLTDWLFQALAAGRSTPVFEDVMFSPLSIDTLARHIALSIARRPIGVYNLGSRDGMSKSDFAFAFAAACGLSTECLQRTSSDSAKQLKAYRPKDMRMDVAHFEAALGMRLPSLSEEIENTGKIYREQA